MEEKDNKKLKKKKKKYVYNPYKVSIIIVVGTILLVIICSLYSKSLNQYLVLTCRINDKSTVDETVRYYYDIETNNMLKYYLNQLYTYDDEETYNSVYDYLVDYKDQLGDFLDTDTLSFVIKKESDTEISAKTFINVNLASNIFDSYMENLGITHEDTIEEVYNTYVANSNYTCTVTEAK